jgi:hypothetical protein
MWRRPVKELEVAEHAVANIGAPMGLPATQRTSLGITPTQCLHFRKFHTSGIWIIPMLTAPIHVYDDSSWTLPSPRRTPRNIAQVDFTQYRLEDTFAGGRYKVLHKLGYGSSTFLHDLACSGPIATRAISTLEWPCKL